MEDPILIGEKEPVAATAVVASEHDWFIMLIGLQKSISQPCRELLLQLHLFLGQVVLH